MSEKEQFQQKVLRALQEQNLAVDISDQQNIEEKVLQETESLDNFDDQSESRIKSFAQNIVEKVSSGFENIIRAFGNPVVGSLASFAQSTSLINKDIIIVPTAGTAGSQNTYSQIDFKFGAVNNSYNNLDQNEIKTSLYNWAERASGNTYDTPILVMGGSWGSTTWAPNAGYGVGVTSWAGAGYVTSQSGFGNLIYFKPASSSIIAALFNNMGIDNDTTVRNLTLTAYNSPTPGTVPTAGISITFGGTGQSGNIIFGGAALNTQTNTVKFSSPFTVSNTTATDTLQIGISAATASTAWVAPGTNGGGNQYLLSTNATTYAKGDLFYQAGTAHSHLIRLPLGVSNTYLFSDGNTPQWTGSIAANTVQINAASGNTQLYPVLNNSNSAGSALSVDVDFYVNPSTNVLQYASGYFYAGLGLSAPQLTSSSAINIIPGIASSQAVQILTATGGTFVDFDTSNRRVGIGITLPVYTLDVVGDINASAGQSYRIGGTLVLNSGNLGTGVTISYLTQLGIVGVGTWSGSAVTGLYGGTGFNSYTVGDLLYAATGTSLGKLAAVTAGQFLVSNGTGAAPQYVAGSGVSVGLATTATNIRVNDAANSTNIHYVPVHNPATSSSGLALSSDTSFFFVPSTDTLSATAITSTLISGPGLAITANNLGGTLTTASQPNVTTMSGLVSIGTITTGVWAGTAITAKYGGIGDFSGTGKSYRILVMGADNSNVTTIDNSTTGYLLINNGYGSAPTFNNTTPSAFTFSSGTLTVNNIAITSGTVSNTPTNATDLVNKSYADSAAGGLDVHASVRATTTAGIAGSYRRASSIANTGVDIGGQIISSVFEILTTSTTGFDVVGTALTTNQRVLVKNGVTGGFGTASDPFIAFSSVTTTGAFGASYVANGIYYVRAVGSATSNWILQRATDTDDNVELTGGTFTFVEEGTTFADTGFVCTVDTTSGGPIGFGATQITFSQFSGAGALSVGQGLAQTGNQVATNFNLAGSTNVLTDLWRGFTVGGTRSGSTGASSYSSLTVTTTTNTSASNTLTANPTGFSLAGGQTNTTLTVAGVSQANTLTGAADGFTLQGGTTARTATVIGGDILLNGGGFGLTLGSQSVLSLNGNTLAIAIGSSNITFQSGVASGSTSATTHNLVQNGQTQFQLSTNATTYTVGDLYYASGTAFTQLTRLAFGTGTGSSVLVRSSTAPVWGTINLASSDFVTGVLGLANGGTNAQAANFTTNGVVIYDGTRLSSATGLTFTAGTGLSVTGSIWSNTNPVPTTSTGAANQVAYYSAATALTSSPTFKFDPTAASGWGVSILVSTTAPSNAVFMVNTNSTMTSGNIVDIDTGGNQRFAIDWKGLTSISGSASGNTTLSVTLGRTILAAPTANYATLNLAASASVNPGAGVTQIGDLWFNGTNLYFRKDATTSQDLLAGTISGSGSADRITKWSSGTALTYSNMLESTAGVGMTITSLNSVGAAGGSTSVLTLQTIAGDDNLTSRYFLRGVSSAGTRYFSIDTAGNLRATTKSFDIPHPTKPGKRLVYGVLEGPEHGVYHRGTVEGKGQLKVELPDYWSLLVGNNYSIHLTGWGNYSLSITDKTDKDFTIEVVGNPLTRKYKSFKADYIVHGSRLDAPLDIEQ